METLRLGLTNLRLHKLRSLLTALGIIFGVAAVITMVAIGEGNKRKVVSDIERLGAKNILLRSVKPAEQKSSSGSGRTMLAYGLKRQDKRRIEATVMRIARIVPLKQVSTSILCGPLKAQGAVIGTLPSLLELTQIRVARGRYLSEEDETKANNVVVLGAALAERLFPTTDPLAGTVRVEKQEFRVVGVLASVGQLGGGSSGTGGGSAMTMRDLNFDAHIPLSAAEARFGDMNITAQQGSFEATQVELSELYVEAVDTGDVMGLSEQIRAVLDTTHAKAGDVAMVVPLELLEQAKRTQRMFNTLMVTIASISLVVGGIGIMNIMLASVTERTREIGVRRALGATRRHIAMQFLVETTVLSGMGGVIGVAMGLLCVGAVSLLQHYLESIQQPYVTLWSIVVSFIVATSVGIIFGLYPAVMAARQDPIVSLRHD
jgi:putative ABC transport system permease protein